MAAWEDESPSPAKERVGAAGEARPDEKEFVIRGEEVQSHLAEFYREELGPEGLRERLQSGTLEVIGEAQSRLVESLSLSCRPAWFRTTKAAILQLEGLKKDQRTDIVKEQLDIIARLQAAYRQTLEMALQEATEEESRKREPSIAPGRWVSIHGTMAADSDLAEKLAEVELEAEKRYAGEFAAAVETLKRLVEEEG